MPKITGCTTDGIDNTCTECLLKYSEAKVIMEIIEITPEMAEWMNEILSPYMVPVADMEVN